MEGLVKATFSMGVIVAFLAIAVNCHEEEVSSSGERLYAFDYMYFRPIYIVMCMTTGKDSIYRYMFCLFMLYT